MKTSLKTKRQFVYDKIQQKHHGENIVINMDELYHEQYKGVGAISISLDSLNSFPNYPQYYQDIVGEKALTLIKDYKYDFNRPIEVVKGFPVNELPYEKRVLINGERYIDIIMDGHVGAVIFTYLGLDSILAFTRNDIKTYRDLNQLFLDINDAISFH